VKRSASILSAAAALLACVSVGCGSGGEGAAPVSSTPGKPADAQTAPGTVTAPKGKAVRVSFDEPAGVTGVQRTVDEGVEEVRFQDGRYAARVRIQSASTQDSIGSLMADYQGQGRVMKATLGGQTGVLVVAPNKPYVSQLFVTVHGGHLYYTQVLSLANEQAKARELMVRLHSSLKLQGG
jgi:hypothetical protein